MMQAIIWDFNGTLYNPKEEKLFKGAKKLLKEASKKYKQAMVSAALLNPKKRRKLIKDLGIWYYFDYIRINIKSPKMFLSVCNKFQCKPEEVYVIGDGYRKEIRTGNKLGMKTIWIDRKGKRSSWRDRLFKKRCWKRIDNMSMLESIL